MHLNFHEPDRSMPQWWSPYKQPIISPSKSEICKNYSRRSYGILKKTLVGNFEVIRFHGNDKLLHIVCLSETTAHDDTDGRDDKRGIMPN